MNFLLSMAMLLSLTWVQKALSEVDFKNCTEDQSLMIRDALVNVRQSVPGLVSEIDTLLSRTLKAKDKKRWKQAKGVLECVQAKLDKFDYVCSSNKKAIYAAAWHTLWTHKIHISRLHAFKSVAQMGPMLMHELSHTCGTQDAAYFNGSMYMTPKERRLPNGTSYWLMDVPQDTPSKTPWHMVASTYEYWMDMGFCLPGQDCKQKLYGVR